MKLYKTGGKVDLSAFMPMLEALGLRVVEEVPTRLHGEGRGATSTTSACSDADGQSLDLEREAERVADAIARGLARRGRVRLAEPARDVARA